jgi:RNA-splicing ligase RtcB
MIELKGAFNTALCFADEIEETAESQILLVCGQKEFSVCKIRVMPDVHAGKGCVVGMSMTLTDKIVPGMVGVDIGCGMETVELAEKEIDFQRLDETIRKSVPAGRNVREDFHPFNNEIELCGLRCAKKVSLDRARRSIGSLGGGNHFIEVGRSDDGRLFLVAHSGSRHLGSEVANLYQKEAARQLAGTTCPQLKELIEKLKSEGRSKEIQSTLSSLKKRNDQKIPEDLAYVSGGLFDDYIHDMRITQRFASLNRLAIIDAILRGLGLTKADGFSTIHNYIDMDSMILRKGAVSAKLGEKLLIPLNMKDGSLICVGKGNNDWNCSAPHGAGRAMSRSKASKTLSLDEYKRQMEGIFTTSVNVGTLDESPAAYKSVEAIVRNISPTAEIVSWIKPVYNFKANE